MALHSHDASRHAERHRVSGLGALRAAVLGADDGIVSTAALVLGVSASPASSSSALVAGIAGLVAGSMSMAAGEWVSVSSQRDAEGATLEQEATELANDPKSELAELESFLQARGLSPVTASHAAQEMTAFDALAAHAVEELGISATSRAQPLQAAGMSAVSFAAGASIPVVAIAVTPASIEAWVVVAVSLVALAALGWSGARAGRARVSRAMARVVIGGAAAMAVTSLIGRLTVSLGL